MRALTFSFGILLLGFSSSTASEYKIFTDWVVDLGEPQVAQDQLQIFYLGSLRSSEMPDRPGFLLAGVQPRVEMRLSKTGRLAWAAALRARSQGGWIAHEDSVVGADVKGNLYRIRVSTGEILWTAEIKGLVFGAPLVHEGHVFVTTSYGSLEAYDFDTGLWAWQQRDPGEATSGIWGQYGPVVFAPYVVAGFPSGEMMAFDATTGNTIWRHQFGSAAGDSMGLNDVRSITSTDGYLIASSFSGDLFGWKAASGSKQLLWQKRLSLAAPAVVGRDGQTVFVSDRSGDVQALELDSGFARWRHSVGSGLATSVLEGEEIIWLGTSDGRVQALDSAGNLLAQTRSYKSPFYGAGQRVSDKEAVFVNSRGLLRRFQLMRVAKLN